MGADIRAPVRTPSASSGVERLSGGTYCIIPDQIEAGTYMAAVAAAGGQLLIRNIIPKHMDCISAKLMEMGVTVEEQDDTTLIRRNGPLQRANVKTPPYPGFPTDMQPQITVALCGGGGDQPGDGGRGYESPPVSACGRTAAKQGRSDQVDAGVAVVRAVVTARRLDARPAGRRGSGHRRSAPEESPPME